MRDVARLAGVSHATVSRYLNGHTNVAPLTGEAIARAVAETGYVPNRAARSLRNRSTGNVVLVAREQADDFYADPTLSRMSAGANSRLSEHGYQMLLALVDSQRSQERVVSLVEGGSFDGALLVAMSTEDPLFTRLRDGRTPIVTASRPSLDTTVPSADTDNEGGSRAIAALLRATGRRRVVELGGPVWAPVSAMRHRGVREAFGQGPDDPDGVPVEWAGRWSIRAGATAMSALLERHPDLDGVVAASDSLATGAIQTLTQAGRRVPEDVGVVGFDDAPLAELGRPRLSTVRADSRATGSAMADLVMGLIMGEDVHDSHVVIGNEIIWRDSAGRLPAEVACEIPVNASSSRL